ncbi:Uncharacterized conserved protein YkwD, contains CAP (CSP/antigen 5/PR1) domain [Clostridium cavendishii DSM 21758]|uniref:Uncharacterized conserved protein YkwD, contains CAP (CSP/antigen 5/PR1) domain n=1 Tax=Clostridium cavendishii DSM 21758 TaxID=1121302 RepID=A0A1M6ANA2_9CLOT|nr:CAP domain-containing protein [Clostridium cavendishii]SHI37966.1 Uncharacterized conserved protein YkwD, contains CAP (CSP/antigen 5/PR1) domain [Clostridium cavendishii DSM 21758]
MNKKKKIFILGIVSILLIGGIVYACVRIPSTNKAPNVAIKTDENKNNSIKDEKKQNEVERKPDEVEQKINPTEEKPKTETPAPTPAPTPTSPKPNVTPTPSAPNNSNPNVIQKKEPNYTNSGSTNTSISYWQDVENIIFTKVNAERAKVSQPGLTLNSQMTGLAREKSKEMIELNYFDHKSPVNGYIQDVMSKRGIHYSAVGENIAMVNGMNLSAEAMASKFMEMWMNSSGHRANILSPNFKEIGIGVARKGNLIKATQVFYTK